MDLPDEVQNEISSARMALEKGNGGKARVCARRAVGEAFRLSEHSKELGRGLSANEILKLIAAADDFPAGVKTAARRLAASVNDEEISLSPVEDALLIIQDLLRAIPGKRGEDTEG